jgi:hypothetical protein
LAALRKTDRNAGDCGLLKRRLPLTSGRRPPYMLRDNFWRFLSP